MGVLGWYSVFLGVEGLKSQVKDSKEVFRVGVVFLHLSSYDGGMWESWWYVGEVCLGLFILCYQNDFQGRRFG